MVSLGFILTEVFDCVNVNKDSNNLGQFQWPHSSY